MFRGRIWDDMCFNTQNHVNCTILTYLLVIRHDGYIYLTDNSYLRDPPTFIYFVDCWSPFLRSRDRDLYSQVYQLLCRHMKCEDIR